MTQKLSDTPQNVLDFVERVRDTVKNTDHPIEADVIAELQKQYRKLYNQYQRKQFNGLSDETILLLEHLHFGLNARIQVQRPLLTAIGKSTDTQFTHTFLQEYIKSAEGYNSVHTKARNPAQNAILMEIFGGLLGVQITEEFVKSVKAEQMMDVILYVASGLQAKDVAAYRKQSPQPLSIDMYLLNKIQEQKHEAVYHLDDTKQNVGKSFIAGHVYPLSGADQELNRVAGRFRSDSCFVNHDTKQIHIGLATSLDGLNTSSQAELIFTFKDALEKTRDAMQGQKGFAFDGYTIHTHLLHGGLFPLDELRQREQLVQRKGKGFDLMIGLGYNLWDETQQKEAIDALNVFPVLAYTAEQNPHNKVAKGLLASNMASLGMDTQDFYHFCNELREQTKKQSITQAQAMTKLAEKTLSYTDRMLDFFNKPHVNVKIGALGKSKMATLVTTMVKSLKNHTLNFPPNALGAKTYSEEHLERLNTTAKKMQAFYDKIKTNYNTSYSSLLDDIEMVFCKYQNGAFLKNTNPGLEVASQFDPKKYRELTRNADKLEQERTQERFENDVAQLFKQGNTQLFGLLEKHVRKQNTIQISQQFSNAINFLKSESSKEPVGYASKASMIGTLNAFCLKTASTFHEEIWQDVLQSTKSYMASSNRANMGEQMTKSDHDRHHDFQQFVKSVTTHFPPSQYEAFYDDVHALAQTCQLVSDQKSVSGTKKVKMK